LNHFLTKYPRQCGFKKSTGCNVATHTLKGTVDYFTSIQSNVSVPLIILQLYSLMLVCALLISQIVLSWVSRLKYLGGTVVATRCYHFKCDFSEAHHTFFGSFNTIYGGVRNANSVSLLLSLLASICTPILLFGTESSLGTTRRETESICSAYNKAWSKKFHTYDKAIILTVSIFAGICLLSTSCTCACLYL